MSKSSVSITSSLLRQLRPHQWVKNLLLGVPLMLAHHLDSIPALIQVAFGFITFSLAASAIYTINDIADVESDRAHPNKCSRPIAAGEISVRTGRIMAAVLLTVSFVIATLMMSSAFITWLVIYVLTTIAYTFVLKKMVLVDVIVLAGLYTMRVAAGGAAADVQVSPWLFAFSLFLFASLAFLKRYAELKATIEREGRQISGRGYHVGDAEFVLIAGPSLGYLAILVFTLYLNGQEVRQLYAHPDRLWFMVPALLYWISRMWLQSHRGYMHEDPIFYAVRDRASYAVAAIVVMIISAARWT